MSITSVVLAAGILAGGINSDPCPSGNWQACPIPWDFPSIIWVPDVFPVELDLAPAEEVEGPTLDSLPELSVPELDAPETLDVPEFPALPPPEEEETDIDEQVEIWLAPVAGLQAALDAWIGESGSLPAASEGDFETGFDDIDDASGGSAFTFASNMGSSIAVVFQYGRAVTGLGFYSIGTLLLFVLGCAAWLALNRFIVFAISIADMLWSVLAQGVQALGEALPWPW